MPYTGEYRTEAVGAAGGYDIWGIDSSQYQGRGARMIGTFSLTKGEVKKEESTMILLLLGVVEVHLWSEEVTRP